MQALSGNCRPRELLNGRARLYDTNSVEWQLGHCSFNPKATRILFGSLMTRRVQSVYGSAAVNLAEAVDARVCLKLTAWPLLETVPVLSVNLIGLFCV